MSSTVEQIKSRLNIVDLVQTYLKLQKAGANFKANCPFHNEKTPSFFVSPARDSWHCFGCNRGGDIFSFIMEIEGLEFLEALKLLANRVGVTLEREEQGERDEKARIKKLIEEATLFFEKKLQENKEVLSYLEDRGLEEETIKKFRLGFAPGPPEGGWRGLVSYLKSKGYSDTEILKSGMGIESQKKSPTGGRNIYDRFRVRIMFPLKTSAGEIVGFSGRIFATAKQPSPDGEVVAGKYINTPQTILFDKSKILYGFYEAKKTIREKEECILVEGQMDVLMSHQAGVLNTVAISGTALSEEHLKQIKRLAETIIISFDSDEAGFNASERSIAQALSLGFEVKLVIMSAGEDPADLIKKNKNLWEKIIKEAESVIIFYLKTLQRRHSDIKELRKEVEKKVLPVLVQIRSEIEQAHFVAEVAAYLQIPEEPIWEEARKIKKNASSLKNKNPQSGEKKMESKKEQNRKEMIEERLVGLILWQRKIAQDEPNINLEKDITDIVEKNISIFTKDNKETLQESKQRIIDKKNKEYYNKLIFEAEFTYNGSEKPLKELEALLKELTREMAKERIEEISRKIRELESSNDQNKLSIYLKEFQELTKRFSTRGEK